MFGDPTTVTVNAVAKNLVRINQDKYSSEYLLRSATDEFRLFIRNSTSTDKTRGVSTDRHNILLKWTVFPVAPATRSYIRTASCTITNEVGDTQVDPVNLTIGLCNFLTATSGSAISKMLNSES